MTRNKLDEFKNEGRLSNSEILHGSLILTPDQILDALNEDQYERITLQWAYYYIPNNYEKVYQLGSTGDKGRDVCAVIDGENDKWELYQCKHYSTQLSPSKIYLEMGKLCYYTFADEYSIPVNYYFVAPKGINGDLEKLLKNPILFKEKIRENWESKCSTKITNKDILLEDKFLIYFNNFDFSIVDWLEPNEFIKQFKTTPFFSRWFGGGLTKTRSKISKANPTIQDNELIYIKELFNAYADHQKSNISSIKDLETYKKYLKHFNRQRDSFYIADSLYLFSRDVLPHGNTSFEDLKKDIYQLVIDIVESDFDSGLDRLKDTIQEAKKGVFDNNPLKGEISVQDKIGICHHLVNDELISWINNE